MWELWRQDEHGNAFLVSVFTEREAAEQACAEMAARGHHQHYWLQAKPEPDDSL